MKPDDLQIGHVLRYDFLWPEEDERGVEHGKDRPCAVVIAIPDAEGSGKRVFVCPITHTPPEDEFALELPEAVKRHLGLDDEPSWVRTNQLNEFHWPERTIPYGLSRTQQGDFTYGVLPYPLRQQIAGQIRRAVEEGRSKRVNRD